jgi:cyclic pyranopterin phosphate synthase
VPMQKELVDPFGRKLSYLRISITDHCNYRCIYCMPDGGVPKLTHDEVLSLEEIARVAKTAVGLGVEKIRLTGGEPLMRRNLHVLLQSLNELEPRPQLALTTNGFLLEKNLEMLAGAGITSVNISLDTLKPEVFARVTGLGSPQGEEAFKRVWSGIMAALELDAFTVKLNQVVLKGINDNEILDFARLTMDHKLVVRFIEYMPVGRQKAFEAGQFMPAENIYRALDELGPLEEIHPGRNDGPARRLKPRGAQGELGVISALSSHFCGTCNRLRLSSNGRLYPCLFSEASVDLRGPLRNGAGEKALINTFLQAATQKPSGHHATPQAHATAGCPMSRLGG